MNLKAIKCLYSGLFLGVVMPTWGPGDTVGAMAEAPGSHECHSFRSLCLAGIPNKKARASRNVPQGARALEKDTQKGPLVVLKNAPLKKLKTLNPQPGACKQKKKATLTTSTTTSLNTQEKWCRLRFRQRAQRTLSNCAAWLTLAFRYPRNI